VAERPGLRPTSDRARETLFNWLQQELAGRRVLDLFAGSGALGFEAASRGAAEVVLVERDAQLAASLRDSAQRLRAGQVQVDCADALAYSPAGFIWDSAIAHGKTFRNYGEFATSTSGWKNRSRKGEPKFLDYYRQFTLKLHPLGKTLGPDDPFSR